MSGSEAVVAAVDLGASSGRVMPGRVSAERLELREAHRFANTPVRVRGTLHWDILALYQGVLDGLAAASREAGRVDAIGIDSWAVDYGLLDADGVLLGNPVNYRDARTDGVMERVVADVGAEDIYATTGLQFLPFNTLYQLVADAGLRRLPVSTLLLIPDLLAYWLTGVPGAERTNASTTQLLDVRTREWATDLMRRVGLDPALFPPLRDPGSRIGAVSPEVGAAVDVPVFAVGSHDTASAVLGVPAESARFAYVSCGTWSLVGLELDKPVLTEDSRRANFTNELGVDGTVRYLRNVMGLWLLQESMRTWRDAGLDVSLEALLREAAALPPRAVLINPDDTAFLPPGDMPARIAAACCDSGQRPPSTPGETVRCILDSLALAYRRTVREAVELSGHDVDVVHIVGGGCQNELLCQLTADACGLPVLAGPVEATALGNAAMQARALGVVPDDRAALRALIRATHPLRRYAPSGDTAAWDHAERQVFG